MNNSDHAHIKNIQNVAHAAVDTLAELGRTDLNSCCVPSLTLVHILTVIYDEAQQVSATGRAATPHIPWADLDDLSHLINQSTIDFDAIWQTIQEKITPLAQAPTPAA